MRRFLSGMTTLIAIAGATPAILLASASPAAALDNGLLKTPAMGFNDWNAFGCGVSEKLIEQTADYMVSSGMAAAGYKYVNIDDCWQEKQRDSSGNLVPDPAKFPDGISGTAAYVHAKGLKLGIYEDAGTATCAGYPGSLGHEYADARSFAAWGVDYLKYDNCNNAGSTTKQQYIDRYTTMRDALADSGRKIVYSICEWGVNGPWTWAPSVGNSWRTTGDIQDSYSSMVGIVHQNMVLSSYAHPGAWNDPDMLEIGNGGMTDTEYKSEFSLWAEMAAPLLAGTDLRTASPQTMAIYLNSDVIAVDQDRAGVQAQVLSSADGHDVFSKPLANGDRAVALFNEGGTPATISTTAAQTGLPRARSYVVKDLWSKKRYETAGRIAAVVPPHGTVMYRVSARKAGAPAPLTSLALSASTATVQPGQAVSATSVLTNYGRTALVDPRVTLSAPDGWIARHTSGWSRAKLRTNASLSTGWVLQPPADAAPGRYTVTVTTTYREQGRAVQESTSTSMVVPYPAVQPPNQTYSSVTTPASSFGQSGDKLQIIGAGDDLWGSTDQYSTIYRPGSERSGTVATVQITSQQNTDPWAKAGLMVRNDITEAGSSPGYLILAEAPGKGYVMQWDANGDGELDSNSAPSDAGTGTAAYPSWLKLVRSGTTFTGYYSTDDSTWTKLASESLPSAASTQDVGVFTSSHSPGVVGEVDFAGFAAGTSADARS